MPSMVVRCYEIPFLSSSWAVPHVFGGALPSPKYSNTLQQQPAAAASCCSSSFLLSQPIIMYACWDSTRRRSAACLYVLGLFSCWQPPPKNCQREFFLYYSDMCPRSRGCLVLTHVDLSVSAQHHTTRILVRSWRLLRVSAAACVSSGNVRRELQFWLIL